MTKSTQDRPRAANTGPDRLSKVGGKSGVELSPGELGQASGGSDGYRTLKITWSKPTP